jgi:hypothetical protein
MSAVPIAQTGHGPCKADLNAEFPGFLNRCSNWSANKTQAATTLWAAKALSPKALKNWSGRRDLNPRPQPWQVTALCNFRSKSALYKAPEKSEHDPNILHAICSEGFGAIFWINPSSAPC